MINLSNLEEQRCDDASTTCCFTPIPKLILKPEVSAMTGGTIQFSAYLRSRLGEVQIQQDLFYQSDNTLLLTINPMTGLATLVATGVVQVSVMWQNLRAFASVTINADCDAVNNSFEILIDNSRSMSDRFNEIFDTKLDVARLMAWQFSVAVNLAKDTIGLVSFNTYPNEIATIGNAPINQPQFSQIQKSDAGTNLLAALELAVSNLNDQLSSRNIIAIFSDGKNHPDLTELQRIQLIDLAKTFKMSGGVIIVVGVRAFDDGFDLLQNLASAGYFINVLSENGEMHVDTAMGLLEGMLQFICSPTPTYLLAYLYEPPADTYPIFPQTADPNPLECDSELRGVKPHYRSTKSYNNGTAPVSATCYSQVSQTDADAKAIELSMLRWTLLQMNEMY